MADDLQRYGFSNYEFTLPELVVQLKLDALLVRHSRVLLAGIQGDLDWTPD
jgi:hypothetical protein